MSGAEEGSIPPPGWNDAPVSGSMVVTPEALTPPPMPPSEALGATGQPAAEAAVRWRISAGTIDNVILYALDLLLCLVLHWKVVSVSNLVLVLVLGGGYHFVLESRGGQTVGKRYYGIQVVSADGGVATPKAIALRSVLRLIDSLLLCYLVGLLSMVLTGPERRQRLGDVVGGTKVIAVSGRAVTRGTSSWVLPAATVVALAYSMVGVVALTQVGHQKLPTSSSSVKAL